MTEDRSSQRTALITIFAAAALLAPAVPTTACSVTSVPLSPDQRCWQPPPFQSGEIMAEVVDDIRPPELGPDPEIDAVPEPRSPREPVALRSARDPALQAELDALLATPGLRRAIKEKRFAAALVDITDLSAPRLATVNGDVMLYAASLPKIAILLGVFEQAANGAFELDEPTLIQATRMIRSSSNPAATAMYYKVGPAKLADVLRSERYRLYNPEWGGGLWVGKPYAKRDTWRRDPIANLSHGATAFQTARFMYLLETGQLVSPTASKEMKKILGTPAIRHKFVKGLGTARPGSKIFRKSGTWRTYHSDAGIIERDGRRYIAVILANDPAGPQWLSNLIVRFDDLIHAAREPATGAVQAASTTYTSR